MRGSGTCRPLGSVEGRGPPARVSSTASAQSAVSRDVTLRRCARDCPWHPQPHTLVLPFASSESQDREGGDNRRLRARPNNCPAADDRRGTAAKDANDAKASRTTAAQSRGERERGREARGDAEDEGEKRHSIEAESKRSSGPAASLPLLLSPRRLPPLPQSPSPPVHVCPSRPFPSLALGPSAFAASAQLGSACAPPLARSALSPSSPLLCPGPAPSLFNSTRSPSRVRLLALYPCDAMRPASHLSPPTLRC